MSTIFCNCTAESKISLNASRHKITENREDIDEWVKNTGFFIQKSIIQNLTKTLREFSLEVDFAEMIDDTNCNDYFSKVAISQFKQICREQEKTMIHN